MFKSEQLVLMNLSDKDRKISYQTQKKNSLCTIFIQSVIDEDTSYSGKGAHI